MVKIFSNNCDYRFCHYSTLIFRLRNDAYHIIYLLTYNNNEVVPLDRIIIGRQ